MVPEFSDWCSIEIPGDDGLLDRVAMAHQRPGPAAAPAQLRVALPAAAPTTARGSAT